MPPKFYQDGAYLEHPLERLFNAPAWDILSAIEHGKRAQVDVKGKLAEHFLYERLVELRDRGVIGHLEWQDRDGQPDFLVDVGGTRLLIECKNVRSGKQKFPDSHYVEIQKTRNSIGGGPSRGYRVDEFHVLAACLFNQTGKWEYLFVATVNLVRRPQWTDFLEIYQPVPYGAMGHWHDTLDQVTGGLVPGV